MPGLHDLTEPLTDIQIAQLQEALTSLQGNILHGHGRDRSAHIFCRFHAHEQTVVKQWIKRLAERQLTSAHRQLYERQQYRDHDIPGRLFMTLLLSAAGYSYLGYDFPRGQPGSREAIFVAGMAAAQARLNDPEREQWEAGYHQESHAMVLLADDDPEFLLRQVRRLLDELTPYATICAIEHGRAMRNAEGNTVEHFGYVDGRSQPLFFQSDLKYEQQKTDGITVWDPSAGPDLALVPDPFGRPAYDSGSYFVFRKLEQNVRGFKEHEEDMARAIGLRGEDAERAGALVVGRFEDGTPVVLQHAEGMHNPVPNNFTYADDALGQKCPFQAHIRKVNPRDMQSRRYRIVRRGITYGVRAPEPKDAPSLDDMPTAGVGLLFMCYQNHIGQQFERMQQQANAPDRPASQAPGTDPVIGQPGKAGPGQQRWPAQWGAPRAEHQRFAFEGFVKLQGGEYFFAPSIHFLRGLE